MRFHFGFSFRPKNIIKYILLGIMGALAFFGVYGFAKADTINYTRINVVNSNQSTTLDCSYNQAGICPTNLTNFPYPPKTEYLSKYIYISFGNNTLINNHTYNFMIKFRVLHPYSDNDLEQLSFLMYQSNNVNMPDSTYSWTSQGYYDSYYGEQAHEFYYNGSFTASSNNSFFAALTFEQQEGIYGVIIDSIYLFDTDTGDELIDSNTQNTIDIMNNATNNTNTIINNQNNNTQQIIDNQTELLGNKCNNLFNPSIMVGFYGGAYYTVASDGKITQSASDGSFWPNATGRIFNLPPGTYTFHIIGKVPTNVFQVYNYNTSSSIFESGDDSFTYTFNETTSLGLKTYGGSGYPNSYYIMINEGTSSSSYCKYGSFTSKLDNVSNSINDLNDTISDDSIDVSSSNSFFGNFNNNTHGLTGIITLPLTTIQNLNNSSCSPLTLTIPFINNNNNLQLPCLTPIYQNNFGNFFTLYQTILFGFVSYYVCINIFRMVKDFKDPNKDKIEVMDL